MAVNRCLYHVGVVVPDIEAAREHLGELLGLEWGPLVESELAKRDADGNDLTMTLRVCFSTEAPYIELIEELPGSVWVCNEHSNLHHIGFWSDSLATDSEGLVAAQCPLQLSGRDGDVAPVVSTYHRDGLGITLELVDVERRPILEQFMFKKPSS